MVLNNENLKRGNPATQFRPGREASENGTKGGKSSGKVRSFQATIKGKIKENPELQDSLADKLINMALNGNLKALEMIISLKGEDKKTEELKLKKKEISFKERELQLREKASNSDVIENEIEDDALSKSLQSLAEEL